MRLTHDARAEPLLEQEKNNLGHKDNMTTTAHTTNTRRSADPWPRPTVDNLVNAIGRPAVATLLLSLGGIRVSLGHAPASRLVSVIGPAHAARLAEVFGAPCTIELPAESSLHRPDRNAEILSGKKAGESTSTLAARHRLTVRQVRRILAVSTAAPPPASVVAPNERNHMSKFKGKNYATDRRFIQEPDISDFIELHAEISSVQYGECLLDDKQLARIKEEWNRGDADDRRTAWTGAIDTLRRVAQTRAQSRA